MVATVVVLDCVYLVTFLSLISVQRERERKGRMGRIIQRQSIIITVSYSAVSHITQDKPISIANETRMASDGPDPSIGRGLTTGANNNNNNNNGMNSPRIQVSLPTNLKMPPRSPSRESVATEMSVSSSYLSECGWNNSGGKLPAHLGFLKAVPENQQLSAYLTPNRGPSPIPGASGSGRQFLRVPGASSGGIGARSIDGGGWWEEETDLNVIKSCAALSKALGLQKSFSTGDIVSLDDSGSPLNQNGTYSTGLPAPQHSHFLSTRQKCLER